MKRKPHSRRKRATTKSVLRLPDLEHAKAAVLNSLTSLDAQRGYRHAIDEFVDWYCSHLESRQLAPGTVNLRLGAVRRLAYEAADCGLLSADLAAGIRRVKGVKKIGVTRLHAAIATSTGRITRSLLFTTASSHVKIFSVNSAQNHAPGRIIVELRASLKS